MYRCRPGQDSDPGRIDTKAVQAARRIWDDTFAMQKRVVCEQARTAYNTELAASLTAPFRKHCRIWREYMILEPPPTCDLLMAQATMACSTAAR